MRLTSTLTIFFVLFAIWCFTTPILGQVTDIDPINPANPANFSPIPSLFDSLATCTLTMHYFDDSGAEHTLSLTLSQTSPNQLSLPSTILLDFDVPTFFDVSCGSITSFTWIVEQESQQTVVSFATPLDVPSLVVSKASASVSSQITGGFTTFTIVQSGAGSFSIQVLGLDYFKIVTAGHSLSTSTVRQSSLTDGFRVDATSPTVKPFLYNESFQLVLPASTSANWAFVDVIVVKNSNDKDAVYFRKRYTPTSSGIIDIDPADFTNSHGVFLSGNMIHVLPGVFEYDSVIDGRNSVNIASRISFTLSLPFQPKPTFQIGSHFPHGFIVRNEPIAFSFQSSLETTPSKRFDSVTVELLYDADNKLFASNSFLPVQFENEWSFNKLEGETGRIHVPAILQLTGDATPRGDGYSYSFTTADWWTGNESKGNPHSARFKVTLQGTVVYNSVVAFTSFIDNLELSVGRGSSDDSSGSNRFLTMIDTGFYTSRWTISNIAAFSTPQVYFFSYNPSLLTTRKYSSIQGTSSVVSANDQILSSFFSTTPAAVIRLWCVFSAGANRSMFAFPIDINYRTTVLDFNLTSGTGQLNYLRSPLYPNDYLFDKQPVSAKLGTGGSHVDDIAVHNSVHSIGLLPATNILSNIGYPIATVQPRELPASNEGKIMDSFMKQTLSYVLVFFYDENDDLLFTQYRRVDMLDLPVSASVGQNSLTVVSSGSSPVLLYKTGTTRIQIATSTSLPVHNRLIFKGSFAQIQFLTVDNTKISTPITCNFSSTLPASPTPGSLSCQIESIPTQIASAAVYKAQLYLSTSDQLNGAVITYPFALTDNKLHDAPYLTVGASTTAPNDQSVHHVVFKQDDDQIGIPFAYHLATAAEPKWTLQIQLLNGSTPLTGCTISYQKEAFALSGTTYYTGLSTYKVDTPGAFSCDTTGADKVQVKFLENALTAFEIINPISIVDVPSAYIGYKEKSLLALSGSVYLEDSFRLTLPLSGDALLAVDHVELSSPTTGFAQPGNVDISDFTAQNPDVYNDFTGLFSTSGPSQLSLLFKSVLGFELFTRSGSFTLLDVPTVTCGNQKMFTSEPLLVVGSAINVEFSTLPADVSQVKFTIDTYQNTFTLGNAIITIPASASIPISAVSIQIEALSAQGGVVFDITIPDVTFMEEPTITMGNFEVLTPNEVIPNEPLVVYVTTVPTSFQPSTSISIQYYDTGLIEVPVVYASNAATPTPIAWPAAGTPSSIRVALIIGGEAIWSKDVSLVLLTLPTFQLGSNGYVSNSNILLINGQSFGFEFDLDSSISSSFTEVSVDILSNSVLNRIALSTFDNTGSNYVLPLQHTINIPTHNLSAQSVDVSFFTSTGLLFYKKSLAIAKVYNPILSLGQSAFESTGNISLFENENLNIRFDAVDSSNTAVFTSTFSTFTLSCYTSPQTQVSFANVYSFPTQDPGANTFTTSPGVDWNSGCNDHTTFLVSLYSDSNANVLVMKKEFTVSSSVGLTYQIGSSDSNAVQYTAGSSPQPLLFQNQPIAISISSPESQQFSNIVVQFLSSGGTVEYESSYADGYAFSTTPVVITITPDEITGLETNQFTSIKVLMQTGSSGSYQTATSGSFTLSGNQIHPAPIGKLGFEYLFDSAPVVFTDAPLGLSFDYPFTANHISKVHVEFYSSVSATTTLATVEHDFTDFTSQIVKASERNTLPAAASTATHFRVKFLKSISATDYFVAASEISSLTVYQSPTLSFGFDHVSSTAPFLFQDRDIGVSITNQANLSSYKLKLQFGTGAVWTTSTVIQTSSTSIDISALDSTKFGYQTEFKDLTHVRALIVLSSDNSEVIYSSSPINLLGSKFHLPTLSIGSFEKLYTQNAVIFDGEEILFGFTGINSQLSVALPKYTIQVYRMDSSEPPVPVLVTESPASTSLSGSYTTYDSTARITSNGLDLVAGEIQVDDFVTVTLLGSDEKIIYVSSPVSVSMVPTPPQVDFKMYDIQNPTDIIIDAPLFVKYTTAWPLTGVAPAHSFASLGINQVSVSCPNSAKTVLHNMNPVNTIFDNGVYYVKDSFKCSTGSGSIIVHFISTSDNTAVFSKSFPIAAAQSLPGNLSPQILFGVDVSGNPVPFTNALTLFTDEKLTLRLQASSNSLLADVQSAHFVYKTYLGHFDFAKDNAVTNHVLLTSFSSNQDVSSTAQVPSSRVDLDPSDADYEKTKVTFLAVYFKDSSSNTVFGYRFNVESIKYSPGVANMKFVTPGYVANKFSSRALLFTDALPHLEFTAEYDTVLSIVAELTVAGGDIFTWTTSVQPVAGVVTPDQPIPFTSTQFSAPSVGTEWYKRDNHSAEFRFRIRVATGLYLSSSVSPISVAYIGPAPVISEVVIQHLKSDDTVGRTTQIDENLVLLTDQRFRAEFKLVNAINFLTNVQVDIGNSLTKSSVKTLNGSYYRSDNFNSFPAGEYSKLKVNLKFTYDSVDYIFVNMVIPEFNVIYVGKPIVTDTFVFMDGAEYSSNAIMLTGTDIGFQIDGTDLPRKVTRIAARFLDSSLSQLFTSAEDDQYNLFATATGTGLTTNLGRTTYVTDPALRLGPEGSPVSFAKYANAKYIQFTYYYEMKPNLWVVFPGFNDKMISVAYAGKPMLNKVRTTQIDASDNYKLTQEVSFPTSPSTPVEFILWTGVDLTFEFEMPSVLNFITKVHIDFLAADGITATGSPIEFRSIKGCSTGQACRSSPDAELREVAFDGTKPFHYLTKSTKLDSTYRGTEVIRVTFFQGANFNTQLPDLTSLFDAHYVGALPTVHNFAFTFETDGSHQNLTLPVVQKDTHTVSIQIDMDIPPSSVFDSDRQDSTFVQITSPQLTGLPYNTKMVSNPYCSLTMDTGNWACRIPITDLCDLDNTQIAVVSTGYTRKRCYARKACPVGSIGCLSQGSIAVLTLPQTAAQNIEFQVKVAGIDVHDFMVETLTEPRQPYDFDYIDKKVPTLPVWVTSFRDGEEFGYFNTLSAPVLANTVTWDQEVLTFRPNTAYNIFWSCPHIEDALIDIDSTHPQRVPQMGIEILPRTAENILYDGADLLSGPTYYQANAQNGICRIFYQTTGVSLVSSVLRLTVHDDDSANGISGNELPYTKRVLLQTDIPFKFDGSFEQIAGALSLSVVPDYLINCNNPNSVIATLDQTVGTYRMRINGGSWLPNTQALKQSLTVASTTGTSHGLLKYSNTIDVSFQSNDISDANMVPAITRTIFNKCNFAWTVKDDKAFKTQVSQTPLAPAAVVSSNNWNSLTALASNNKYELFWNCPTTRISSNLLLVNVTISNHLGGSIISSLPYRTPGPKPQDICTGTITLPDFDVDTVYTQFAVSLVDPRPTPLEPFGAVIQEVTYDIRSENTDLDVVTPQPQTVLCSTSSSNLLRVRNRIGTITSWSISPQISVSTFGTPITGTGQFDVTVAQVSSVPQFVVKVKYTLPGSSTEISTTMLRYNTCFVIPQTSIYQRSPINGMQLDNSVWDIFWCEDGKNCQDFSQQPASLCSSGNNNIFGKKFSTTRVLAKSKIQCPGFLDGFNKCGGSLGLEIRTQLFTVECPSDCSSPVFNLVQTPVSSTPTDLSSPFVRLTRNGVTTKYYYSAALGSSYPFEPSLTQKNAACNAGLAYSECHDLVPTLYSHDWVIRPEMSYSCDQIAVQLRSNPSCIQFISRPDKCIKPNRHDVKAPGTLFGCRACDKSSNDGMVKIVDGIYSYTWADYESKLLMTNDECSCSSNVLIDGWVIEAQATTAPTQAQLMNVNSLTFRTETGFNAFAIESKKAQQNLYYFVWNCENFPQAELQMMIKYTDIEFKDQNISANTFSYKSHAQLINGLTICYTQWKPTTELHAYTHQPQFTAVLTDSTGHQHTPARFQRPYRIVNQEIFHMAPVFESEREECGYSIVNAASDTSTVCRDEDRSEFSNLNFCTSSSTPQIRRYSGLQCPPSAQCNWATRTCHCRPGSVYHDGQCVGLEPDFVVVPTNDQCLVTGNGVTCQHVRKHTAGEQANISWTIWDGGDTNLVDALYEIWYQAGDVTQPLARQGVLKLGKNDEIVTLPAHSGVNVEIILIVTVSQTLQYKYSKFIDLYQYSWNHNHLPTPCHPVCGTLPATCDFSTNNGRSWSTVYVSEESLCGAPSTGLCTSIESQCSQRGQCNTNVCSCPMGIYGTRCEHVMTYDLFSVSLLPLVGSTCDTQRQIEISYPQSGPFFDLVIKHVSSASVVTILAQINAAELSRDVVNGKFTYMVQFITKTQDNGHLELAFADNQQVAIANSGEITEVGCQAQWLCVNNGIAGQCFDDDIAKNQYCHGVCRNSFEVSPVSQPWLKCYSKPTDGISQPVELTTDRCNDLTLHVNCSCTQRCSISPINHPRPLWTACSDNDTNWIAPKKCGEVYTRRVALVNSQDQTIFEKNSSAVGSNIVDAALYAADTRFTEADLKLTCPLDRYCKLQGSMLDAVKCEDKCTQFIDAENCHVADKTFTNSFYMNVLDLPIISTSVVAKFSQINTNLIANNHSPISISQSMIDTLQTLVPVDSLQCNCQPQALCTATATTPTTVRLSGFDTNIDLLTTPFALSSYSDVIKPCGDLTHSAPDTQFGYTCDDRCANIAPYPTSGSYPAVLKYFCRAPNGSMKEVLAGETCGDFVHPTCQPAMQCTAEMVCREHANADTSFTAAKVSTIGYDTCWVNNAPLACTAGQNAVYRQECHWNIAGKFSIKDANNWTTAPGTTFTPITTGDIYNAARIALTPVPTASIDTPVEYTSPCIDYTGCAAKITSFTEQVIVGKDVVRNKVRQDLFNKDSVKLTATYRGPVDAGYHIVFQFAYLIDTASVPLDKYFITLYRAPIALANPRADVTYDYVWDLNNIEFNFVDYNGVPLDVTRAYIRAIVEVPAVGGAKPNAPITAQRLANTFKINKEDVCPLTCVQSDSITSTECVKDAITKKWSCPCSTPATGTITSPTCDRTTVCDVKGASVCKNGGYFAWNPTFAAADECADRCTCPNGHLSTDNCATCAKKCNADYGNPFPTTAQCGCDSCHQDHSGKFCDQCTYHAGLIVIGLTPETHDWYVTNSYRTDAQIQARRAFELEMLKLFSTTLSTNPGGILPATITIAPTEMEVDYIQSYSLEVASAAEISGTLPAHFNQQFPSPAVKVVVKFTQACSNQELTKLKNIWVPFVQLLDSMATGPSGIVNAFDHAVIRPLTVIEPGSKAQPQWLCSKFVSGVETFVDCDTVIGDAHCDVCSDFSLETGYPGFNIKAGQYDPTNAIKCIATGQASGLYEVDAAFCHQLSPKIDFTCTCSEVYAAGLNADGNNGSVWKSIQTDAWETTTVCGVLEHQSIGSLTRNGKVVSITPNVQVPLNVETICAGTPVFAYPGKDVYVTAQDICQIDDKDQCHAPIPYIRNCNVSFSSQQVFIGAVKQKYIDAVAQFSTVHNLNLPPVLNTDAIWADLDERTATCTCTTAPCEVPEPRCPCTPRVLCSVDGTTPVVDFLDVNAQDYKECNLQDAEFGYQCPSRCSIVQPYQSNTLNQFCRAKDGIIRPRAQGDDCQAQAVPNAQITCHGKSTCSATYTCKALDGSDADIATPCTLDGLVSEDNWSNTCYVYDHVDAVTCSEGLNSVFRRVRVATSVNTGEFDADTEAVDYFSGLFTKTNGKECINYTTCPQNNQFVLDKPIATQTEALNKLQTIADDQTLEFTFTSHNQFLDKDNAIVEFIYVGQDKHVETNWNLIQAVVQNQFKQVYKISWVLNESTFDYFFVDYNGQPISSTSIFIRVRSQTIGEPNVELETQFKIVKADRCNIVDSCNATSNHNLVSSGCAAKTNPADAWRCKCKVAPGNGMITDQFCKHTQICDDKSKTVCKNGGYLLWDSTSSAADQCASRCVCPGGQRPEDNCATCTNTCNPDFGIQATDKCGCSTCYAGRSGAFCEDCAYDASFSVEGVNSLAVSWFGTDDRNDAQIQARAKFELDLVRFIAQNYKNAQQIPLFTASDISIAYSATHLSTTTNTLTIGLIFTGACRADKFTELKSSTWTDFLQLDLETSPVIAVIKSNADIIPGPVIEPGTESDAKWLCPNTATGVGYVSCTAALGPKQCNTCNNNFIISSTELPLQTTLAGKYTGDIRCVGNTNGVQYELDAVFCYQAKAFVSLRCSCDEVCAPDSTQDFALWKTCTPPTEDVISVAPVAPVHPQAPAALDANSTRQEREAYPALVAKYGADMIEYNNQIRLYQNNASIHALYSGNYEAFKTAYDETTWTHGNTCGAIDNRIVALRTLSGQRINPTDPQAQSANARIPAAAGALCAPTRKIFVKNGSNIEPDDNVVNSWTETNFCAFSNANNCHADIVFKQACTVAFGQDTIFSTEIANKYSTLTNTAVYNFVDVSIHTPDYTVACDKPANLLCNNCPAEVLCLVNDKQTDLSFLNAPFSINDSNTLAVIGKCQSTVGDFGYQCDSRCQNFPTYQSRSIKQYCRQLDGSVKAITSTNANGCSAIKVADTTSCIGHVVCDADYKCKPADNSNTATVSCSNDTTWGTTCYSTPSETTSTLCTYNQEAFFRRDANLVVQINAELVSYDKSGIATPATLSNDLDAAFIASVYQQYKKTVQESKPGCVEYSGCKIAVEIFEVLTPVPLPDEINNGLQYIVDDQKLVFNFTYTGPLQVTQAQQQHVYLQWAYAGSMPSFTDPRLNWNTALEAPNLVAQKNSIQWQLDQNSFEYFLLGEDGKALSNTKIFIRVEYFEFTGDQATVAHVYLPQSFIVDKADRCPLTCSGPNYAADQSCREIFIDQDHVDWTCKCKSPQSTKFPTATVTSDASTPTGSCSRSSVCDAKSTECKNGGYKQWDLTIPQNDGCQAQCTCPNGQSPADNCSTCVKKCNVAFGIPRTDAQIIESGHCGCASCLPGHSGPYCDQCDVRAEMEVLHPSLDMLEWYNPSTPRNSPVKQLRAEWENKMIKVVSQKTGFLVSEITIHPDLSRVETTTVKISATETKITYRLFLVFIFNGPCAVPIVLPPATPFNVLGDLTNITENWSDIVTQVSNSSVMDTITTPNSVVKANGVTVPPAMAIPEEEPPTPVEPEEPEVTVPQEDPIGPQTPAPKAKSHTTTIVVCVVVIGSAVIIAAVAAIWFFKFRDGSSSSSSSSTKTKSKPSPAQNNPQEPHLELA